MTAKFDRPSRALLIALALTCAAPAWAQDAGTLAETAGPALSAPPAAWLGATPHFVMMGSVNGTVFNVQMPDMAKAEGVAGFAAKREYDVVEGGHAYVDFEVGLEAVIGGVERQIEIEMENADFATHTLPADFALHEAEFPAGLLSNLETQWEWEAGGTSFNEEVTGWTGTLRIEADTGSADDKGLVGDGVISGFISATRGSDVMVISFTVPVAEYEIND